jgi:hypothetical protein
MWKLKLMVLSFTLKIRSLEEEVLSIVRKGKGYETFYQLMDSKCKLLRQEGTENNEQSLHKGA